MFALMQDVQTRIFLGVPPTTARTVWMLGVHRRLVLRWEWLIDFPNRGAFPQTSHTFDIRRVSHNEAA